MSSDPRVISTNDWETSALRYMKPRVNDLGGTAVSVISGQSGRSLYLSTPGMTTWGVSDYVDPKTGESDGKFTMNLAFPTADYTNKNIDTFLKKVKEFENRIVNDAVVHSEAWFGEEKSREILKDSFFPCLKYPKDKLTKKVDYNRPPQLKLKVPYYGGQWQNLEIYDTKEKLLFPSDNENDTPIDLVPKKSKVACVIQCGGVWITGRQWGVTWKLSQCVVKPPENTTIFGKCNVQLSLDELNSIETQQVDNTADEEDSQASEKVVEDTVASDSDEEEDVPAPAPAPAPKKKVVRKAAPVEEETVEELPAPKKKVVRKKAVAE